MPHPAALGPPPWCVPRCVPIPARAATKEELASVHIPGFVDNVVDDFPTMTLQELKHRGKA